MEINWKIFVLGIILMFFIIWTVMDNSFLTIGSVLVILAAIFVAYTAPGSQNNKFSNALLAGLIAIIIPVIIGSRNMYAGLIQAGFREPMNALIMAVGLLIFIYIILLAIGGFIGSKLAKTNNTEKP